jgi:ATP-dependent Clp protease ATP-binding subunit ClpA
MTTNAGATELQKNSMGFGALTVEGADDKVIERTFAPEFRNRLDAVVKFHALSRDNMLKVVEKFTKQLSAQALERGVILDISGEAKQWLAEKGYDPKMGARPLERVIQNHLSKKLSRAMLFGDLKDGGVAKVTVRDDDLDVAKVVPDPLLLEKKDNE